ncbi:MAG TPA: IclR family transcriptional regulator C-terminal domain-containing protein, partial [Steroidobacteraceae bacterium]|nr:IclR family transcriptional regulator C-terminal domain-containing protein [Steroidobacteraceae bacterium]
AVFTDQVQGAHRLRAVSAIGETFPLYCTANGKALLAIVSEDKLERLLRNPMPRLTPNTITKSAVLKSQIELIRRTGLAYDLEEHTEGISAVGTAFTDPLGRAVALSIPAPSSRFEKHKAVLGKKLLAARSRIVEALGGAPPA